MDESLVIKTLDKALRERKPDGELILHSDRGSQYASMKLRQMLIDNNIQQSMSSKGNCYDNAPTESFFSTLKTGVSLQNKLQNQRRSKTEFI